MNKNEFLELVSANTSRRLSLLKSKGDAYSGTQNPFQNFERNAAKLGLTKYQVWAVYCGKHLDAIFNAIRANPACPQDRSEGIAGRVDDAINYLELFAAMAGEEVIESTQISTGPAPTTAEIAERILALIEQSEMPLAQKHSAIVNLLEIFYGSRNFSL